MVILSSGGPDMKVKGYSSQKLLCSGCGNRPPHFRVKNGPLKIDKKHNLCLACHRNEINRYAAMISKRIQYGL